MKKLVCGVGINDSDCVIGGRDQNGKKWICPFYSRWVGMLTRCYSLKWQEKNQTYVGCTVCNEWHRFSSFKRWMETQDWKGKELDKDIIYKGNKVYCPDTCVFVDYSINLLLTDSRSARGKFPNGVYFNKKECVFVAQIKEHGKKRRVGKGLSEQEAHAAWQKAKAEYIEQVANEQTDERIKNGLMLRVHQLRDDLANGRETIKL